MTSKKYVIMLAGGSGVRMGTDLPKQFLELDGMPVLQLSIRKFVDAVPDIRVVTVLPAQYLSWWKDYCLEKGFHQPQILVKGGITRFHSVKNALEKIPDGVTVAVHDAARPLLSTDMVRRMFELMEDRPALVPVVPAADTMIALGKGDDGELGELYRALPPREELFCVQTPQLFQSDILRTAYRQPYEVSFTDDASVVRKMKIPISYTDGEKLNFKLTSPQDLVLARAVTARSR